MRSNDTKCLTGLLPLVVALLALLTEGVRTPRREDETEVGRDSLGSSQAEKSLEGQHLDG
jgi:hypothetical protein